MRTRQKLWLTERTLEVTQKDLSIAKAENRLLKAEIRLNQATMAAQRADIRNLLELLNQPKPEPSRTPLHVSEAEEDVIFARDTKLLGIAEAEDMLRELQFEHPNVYVDDGEAVY